MRCPACKNKTLIQQNFANPKKRKVSYLCMSCKNSFARDYYNRSRLAILGTVGGGLALLLILLPLPMRGLLRLLPKGDPAAATAIVVLGRGPDTQIDLALSTANLWVENQQQTIFISGMSDAPEIMKFIQEMGVPEDKITGERCSQTTWENGLFSSQILKGYKVNKVILITDDFHMPRSALVFKGFGFDIAPHPIRSKVRSQSFVKEIKFLLREYAALASYGSSDKFSFQSLDERQQTEAEIKAVQTIQDWGCYLE
ncbi:hypothetical protein C7293_12490 [filamentous cyanobacterium CCT1]|nr:hypothetical protein C7293_12490 [filamentous cyanobacterium CCT1]PSN79814.1 hypothetical protein C8B47_09665 [filamentous cyanobacterium CCP4]